VCIYIYIYDNRRYLQTIAKLLIYELISFCLFATSKDTVYAHFFIYQLDLYRYCFRFSFYRICIAGRESAADIATGYWPDSRGVGSSIAGRVKKFYATSYPAGIGDKASGARSSQHQPVPRPRKRGPIYQLPVSLHGVVLN
jgi:hypothetical protein